MEPVLHMKYKKTFSNNCWHCGADPIYRKKFKKCSGCYQVRYCSQECQKNDWSAHKIVCKRLQDIECTKKEKIVIYHD